MSKRDSEDELDDLFEEDSEKIDQIKTKRSNSRGPKQTSASKGRTTRTTVGSKDRSSTLSRGRATQSGRKTDFQDSRLSEQARKLISDVDKQYNSTLGNDPVSELMFGGYKLKPNKSREETQKISDSNVNSRDSKKTSTTTSGRTGHRGSILSPLSDSKPKTNMPNFRETLGQSKETYKISGAAKGAVLDAQKRMTVAEDSYNPVADLMFGGMGKKVEDKPKPNMRRESLTVANMPNMTNLKKLQQPSEKLTAAKKDTLQRKGNVKIIDKTITNTGTLAPEVTPGVMLTRPSIGQPTDDADKPAPKPKKSVSDRRLSMTPKLPKPLPALSNTDQKMAASAMDVPSFNVQRASIVAPAGTAMLPKLVKKESSDGVLDIENKLIARVSKQKRSSFIDIGTSKQMMSKLERRSSFMVTSDGPRDSHNFKNAADRVRRMSMIMPKRNSVQQRMSTDLSSTNLGARLSLNPGSPLARRNSIMRASTVTKAEDVDPDLHHENMTQNAEALTQEQVRAFKEAFDLFDSNGGGTIDAEELKATLDSVGIEIEQEDIEDVMMKLDEDGNGEIDFEEFLNLMTNTEMFLEAFARKKNEDEGAQEANTNRDVLLFDALSEFMKKSALKAADEIVGYYSKKFRKVVKNYNMNKGAHVVGHYADGARLIGLTEKQIYRELKRLRMYSNLTDREKNSPYAQPLHLALLKSTNKTRKIRKPRRQNSSRSVNSNRSCSKLAQKMDLEPKTKEELLEARKRRSEKKERVKKRQSYRRTEIKEEQEIKRKSLVKEKIKESLMHMPTASAPRDTTGIPEHRRTGKIRLKISKHAKKDDKGLLRKISELGRIEAERESVKVKKNDSQILPMLHRPGWMIQRTTLLNVDMPIPPKYSTLTKNFGFLPKLRKVVQDKQKEFNGKQCEYKKKNYNMLFRQLDTRSDCYTESLMNSFIAAGSAYSCASPGDEIRLNVELLQQMQTKDRKLKEQAEHQKQLEKNRKMIDRFKRIRNQKESKAELSLRNATFTRQEAVPSY